MDMKIETIPHLKIAYLRHTGAYGTGNVQTMENLKKWAKSHHLLNDESIILGIAQDNPETTPPENNRYDACLVLPDGDTTRDDCIRFGTIVGGKYAVFTIGHTSQAVQKAWRDIFPELLRKGYQVDPIKPIIERYAAKMVKNHMCEICVPVC